MTSATGVRIGWHELPQEVRSAVADILGGPVVEAVSQPGGFSPGTADRVRTASGRRAFVKAVSPAQNSRSRELLCAEAGISALLPAWIPAPRLLGCYDNGYWIALALEDIDGRHPRTPWVSGELEAVLATLRTLAARGTPSPLADLPSAVEMVADQFEGWRRIAEDPPADLHPWAAPRLPELVALADRGRVAVAGATLTHLDVRADNLLIGRAGAVTLVDWPWACRGAAWLDTLLLLINVRLYGGHDTDALLARHARADPADLTGALAGFAGFLADVSRRPAPPGLPTVRACQRAQHEVVLGWVRARLDG
jgi:hypothetical protein